MEAPFTTRLSNRDPAASLMAADPVSALLARAITPFAVIRPFRRLTFSSVALLSALPADPVAVAKTLSAPTKFATLTLGALASLMLPSVGSTAKGDVVLAVGVNTATPNERAVGVWAHASVVGSAALNRRPRTTNPQAPPLVVACLFMVQSSVFCQCSVECYRSRRGVSGQVLGSRITSGSDGTDGYRQSGYKC